MLMVWDHSLVYKEVVSSISVRRELSDASGLCNFRYVRYLSRLFFFLFSNKEV